MPLTLSGFPTGRWLYYDSSQDRSFCYTRVRTVNVGKLCVASGNTKDSPSVRLSVVGFPTGRMLLSVAFARHKQTTTHKTAVEVLLGLYRHVKQPNQKSFVTSK